MAAVLVFDGSEDTLEMLSTYLSSSNLHVHTCLLTDVEAGRVDPVELIQRVRADVVVYDIDPPYTQKWQSVLELALDPAVSCPFVFTTTNPTVVADLLKNVTTATLLAKPYDPAELRAAIERALVQPGERRRSDRRGFDRRQTARRRTHDSNE